MLVFFILFLALFSRNSASKKTMILCKVLQRGDYNAASTDKGTTHQLAGGECGREGRGSWKPFRKPLTLLK